MLENKQVYLDNGATSYPKAPGVSEAIVNYIDNIGSSVGRGTYESALSSERILYETRMLICDLFNFPKSDNVIFTKNITESMNVIIKGLFKSGDHVIVSSMEHNAVMRPLNSMAKHDVTFTRVACDISGAIDPKAVERAIKPNTKAIIMTHSSNVCGTIMDLEDIGKLAEAHDLFFIIDAAQTAGYLDVDYVKLKADAICFTGHKSLLGPTGIGGFVISDVLAEQVDPFIEGGTGSASDIEIQPSRLPDKFESGTPNLVGIYGLNAALKYIKSIGLDKIRAHEEMLTSRFINGLKGVSGLRLVGKEDIVDRTAVVSVDFENDDNGMVAFALDREYGISTRVGMHCAPSAHKTLNTYPQGTVRFSFSYHSTVEEIDYAVESVMQYISSKK